MYAANLSLESIPDEISQWVDLEVLDVSYNQLTSLPSCMSELTLMKRIAATHNKLSGANSFPELDDCYEIQHIDISFNNFEENPLDFERMEERGVEMIMDGNPCCAKLTDEEKKEVRI